LEGEQGRILFFNFFTTYAALEIYDWLFFSTTCEL
jgi:hypothetical protein